MKVLIVEDNADSRNLLVKQLSAYGHEVTAAVDGVDALEKALKSPPDILVSDILMPRMDGYKLCYEWKQNKQLKDIPFVFYTAIYTSSKDEKFGLSLGANLFIRKPLEPEALVKILSQVFEQAKEGLLPAAKAPPKPSLYMTEYNERLVAKLNEKVAELEKSEEELRYLSSVLGAIRDINQLIVRERDKTKLLRGACRILHKVRDYRFVWIGLIEAGHKRVIPVARAGVENKYLDEVKITWDDSPRGRGPTGTAIKTKKPDLIKDIPVNPRAARWRDEALKRGYRSSAAIPLIHNGKVYGALNVYSSQLEGFNDAEVELLVEVGGDLAFALQAIERQEARQRAEEALKESNKRFTDIAENALQLIWEVDAKGKYTYVSPIVEQILGYKPEEVIGKSFYDLFHPDDREEIKKLTFAAFAAKQPFRQFSSRLVRKNGEIAWLLATGVPILDEAGKLLGYRGAVLDITELKQAEEALRESEANLAEAQRVAHIGSWELDVASGKLHWSDEVYRMFGMEPQQAGVTYETFKERVHPDDRKLVDEAYRDAVKAGKPFSLVHRILREDGAVKYVEERGETFYDDKGKPVRSIGTAQDITERMLAEEALRESEEKYKTLTEDVPIGIYFNDFKGTFLYGNKKAAEIVGYKREELLGKSFAKLKLLGPKDIAKALKLLALNKLGRATGPDRFVLNRKDGTKAFVEIRTRITTVGGEKVVLGMVEDITERRQAEEALRESEEFQSGLLANSPFPISVINPDTSVRYVNPALVKLTGFSTEELTGEKAPYSYWLEEDKARTMKGFEKAMRQGSKGVVEPFKKKNGEKFWVEITSTPVKKDGRFQYLLVSWVDITERKQAEEALRESEARYRAVIEGAHDMIQSVSLDGRIIFVNKSWLGTLGYTEAELSDLKMSDILHPDFREQCRQVMDEVAKGKSVQDMETAFKTKDGRKILVEGNVTPRYIGKKVVASHGIFRDVTERKRAEAALADEATRRRILIDESSDGIVILDEDGKVYEANRRFAEMLGYTPEEVRKLSVWDWEYQYPREQVAEMIRTVDEAGDHFETRHRRKDGTVFDVEISTNGAIYAGQKLIFCVCRDITARNQAAAALSQSEEKLRVILESIPLGVTVTDLEGKILQVNNASLRVHGYNTREEIIGLGAFELITEEGRARAADNLKTTLETGRSGAVEYTLLRKDGTTYPAQLSAAVVKDESNKPIGFVAVIEDITERKQAEAKLRDEATRRRILIDESSDGIVILGEDGKVYEANKRFAEMLGYTPEEVLKLHIWDFEALRNREQVLEQIKTLGPEGDHFETRHRRKDGTVFDVEVSSNSAVYAGQKLIFGVSRDITERKQAEEALRESEEKYKNLVGATSDIIWETDAEGRFTFISPKVKDILGYEVDEVVGKKRTLDLVPKDQFQRWLKRFKELNAKKAAFFGLEIAHLHKNGRQVIFETSGIPLFDSAGKLKGYVGINKDVTERRQMQEQLVITDRLASVGELAAGIAHELNNPLTGVIGFSQLLLDKEMPEDVKQDVKVVYSEARRASQVVKNLLTFARKHAAAKEKVNINDIINKVLELRAYEQNLENIKVTTRFDPELPEIMVDYFQLQQVFLNIVINAEYFMKEAHHGGELTITTEKVGNKVKASFADDGPGIAKENLGHLFDPFFTTKEVGKGTGLGLSICHGIVAEHGGRIYVESELGEGATFIVELPIGAAEKKEGAV